MNAGNIKRLLTELNNKYFYFLLGSGFLVLLLWYFKISRALNIISLGIYLSAYIFFFLKKGWEKDSFPLSKAFDIIVIVLLSFSLIIYTFFVANEITGILIMLLLFVFLAFATPTSLVFYKIATSSRKLWVIIIFYIVFSICLNLLFGFSYSLVEPLENNSLSLHEGGALDAWEYIFYSVSNYYSHSFIQVEAQGHVVQGLTVSLLIISAVMHVIVLGLAVNNSH